MGREIDADMFVIGDSPPKIRFAPDSPLEGAGFEPSVPLEYSPSGSPLVVSADLSTLPSRKRSSQRIQRLREPDSNHRFRSCERLFWALPIGDGGTKGGATYMFRPETAMLAWSGSP